jgi:hypothetical protein
MAIQNSRSRKAARSKTMEQQQAEVINGAMNGMEKGVLPLPDGAAPAKGDGAEPPKQPTIALQNLMEKREKMMQGLNSVKAQREAIQERLKELETSVSRTEGALYTLETLIQELDPQALQQPQGAR